MPLNMTDLSVFLLHLNQSFVYLTLEHCGVSVSEVAMRRRHNVVTLSSRVSAAILSSPSVGVAQVWSHCWTYYLLNEGDRMGHWTIGTRGGSDSARYK